ncbi:MAG: hypothetical protein M1835_000881 [Candelina submexicana]|nr:MAG: hypothetical protein M1835_000881 [Candelina submexicana]
MKDANEGIKRSSPSHERSPLLGKGQGTAAYNSSVEGAEAARDIVNTNEGGDEPNIPIAEEPNSTIIATLTAPISSSFNSASLLSWLASAYLIANAALQPLSGRLTDIYSRRTGLVFSNIFFCAGNLICGLARREWVIILGRVIAGMGGGGLTAISTFVASDLVPLRRRGLWQGFGNVSYGIGSGLGGIFGGWINDIWGWRIAFLIQVPLVVVSGILIYFTVDAPVKETNKPSLKRVDFLGAISLVTTLVFLLVALNSGGNQVPWTHPLVLTTLPLSAVSLGVFIFVEENVASEPIIPVRLLLNRTVASACLTNWFATMSLYAFLFFGPIFFQIQGMSTTAAGARLIPQSLGSAVGSLGAGFIMNKTGRYYILNVGVEGIFVLGGALIATLMFRTPTWLPFLYFFFSGVGYGGMLTITLLALISAVDHKYQAVITSASYAFRSTGSTIGITIASAVFQNILKMGLWAKLGDMDNAAEIIGKIRNSFEEIKYLPPGWRECVMASYMDALRGVFMTTVGISVLGALVSLGMREHTLYSNLARK